MTIAVASTKARNVHRLAQAGLHVAIVIPCYQVARHIEDVIRDIPAYIRTIILVNDASTDQTARILDGLYDARVLVIHHPCNAGVGGATLTGMRRALDIGADIIIKMDGDGQMDPSYLPHLIEPLAKGKADFAKGNRFTKSAALRSMPLIRKIGNSGLSFLAKVASGYWNSIDPTNGYFAIRGEVFELLDERDLHPRYFFECSLLCALGVQGAVVRDIPMPAIYGNESSHLSIGRTLMEFPWLLLRGALKRFWVRKILYSFTMEALFAILGTLLVVGGLALTSVQYHKYAILLKVQATAGTVMMCTLPLVLGVQMLLTMILLDIQSVPMIPLCDRLSDYE